MSEREDHFNLGSGWPPWKEEPSDNRGVRALIDRAISEPVNRIASYIAIGAMIGGLCSLCLLLWWWLPISHRPIVEAPARPILIPRSEAEAIAIAAIKRRENWSGKVIVASPKESAWHVWIAREPATRGREREIREIEISTETGELLNYNNPSPDALPDPRWLNSEFQF
jgi:hypothetical protein